MSKLSVQVLEQDYINGVQITLVKINELPHTDWFEKQAHVFVKPPEMDNHLKISLNTSELDKRQENPRAVPSELQDPCKRCRLTSTTKIYAESTKQIYEIKSLTNLHEKTDSETKDVFLCPDCVEKIHDTIQNPLHKFIKEHSSLLVSDRI